MSGEIPTYDRAFEAVTARLQGNIDWLEADGLHNFVLERGLPSLYAAIHRFYEMRGETSLLERAMEESADNTQEQAAIRARLLEEFGIGSDEEAHELLASYWQGDRPDDLGLWIKGRTASSGYDIYKQATHFAKEATADNPEALQRVQKAIDLLWRDYRPGIGN